jgi:hypothetical protein
MHALVKDSLPLDLEAIFKPSTQPSSSNYSQVSMKAVIFPAEACGQSALMFFFAELITLQNHWTICWQLLQLRSVAIL